VTRRDVTFDSGGSRCAAWLWADAELRPCVVLAHGFGATRIARLDAYAERFAAAGFAALAFDYRHFGDSEGEPRQLLDIGRQLDDWRAAVRFARSLDGVDSDRIVLWGTSFGGGHVARIAAEDARVAAAISQAPYVDGIAALAAAGAPDVWRMTVAGVRDELQRLRRRPPHMIPIVGPPGRPAIMNSPDADPGYRAMFEPGAPFRNEVAARVALRVALYSPGRAARRIKCPWLVAVADGDAVTPPQPALKAAMRAPRGEVRRYEGGHFDVYRGELFERAVEDQIDFVRRNVGLTQPPRATQPQPAGQPGR
jgi:cephalosporin-C deacetylase-like acetyl esterase